MKSGRLAVYARALRRAAQFSHRGRRSRERLGQRLVARSLAQPFGPGDQFRPRRLTLQVLGRTIVQPRIEAQPMQHLRQIAVALSLRDGVADQADHVVNRARGGG